MTMTYDEYYARSRENGVIANVIPRGNGRWLCEVFIIGGERIAHAETPKGAELTRPAAEKFAEAMALLCKNMPWGEYTIHVLHAFPMDNPEEVEYWPYFNSVQAKGHVALEKIGTASLKRGQKWPW